MSKIAYLTGEYPRATDTFIQREVAALRDEGRVVLTCSVRRTAASHMVGPEQKAEAKNTFYLLEQAKNPVHLLRCHLRAMRTPGRYFGALKLALRTGGPGFKSLIYQLFYFAEAAVLADHLKKQNVAHLHNHIATASANVAMITSAMSGIPFSFTLHGPDIFFAPHRWRLDEKIARAQFVACISHFCRSQAMAFSQPEDWSKLHIVHCGVEPARYQTSEDRKRGKDLLFVGRLAAVKGVPILLRAMKAILGKHPDATLTLIGDGPDRADLEKTAQELGLKGAVRFVGYQSQSEVAAQLQASDILVLPSFAEGVPVVLMEAMAARLPVVTTRIAGIPELVEDNITGELVPPGDVVALEAAIVGLLDHPETQKSMGEAGRRKVEAEFTVRKEARWLDQILRAYAEGGKVGLRPDGPPDE